MLYVRDLCKVFAPGTPNAHTALKHLDLHLAPGEFVTVIGSNGAGKSTLFSAISGGFWADSGSVFLDGENITYLPEYKRAAKIGRLFQDPMKGTAPHMTIEENLALSYSRSQRRGLHLAVCKKDRDFFRSALAEFGMGLEDRMDAQVGLLSGGQRQALTLLMSTIVPPKLLLLDEHTAALDPATAQKVLEITKKIVSKNHLTAMMITHNIQSALTCGSRTIMMDEGQIILDLCGEERKKMTVSDLMELYAEKQHKTLDNDRMLLG
jgi:putative ABC transport system ATP-binding protein